MGLPKLQDYLSLVSNKRSAEGLRTALNKFIDDLEQRPRLTEEDIKEVVADLTSQMNRHGWTAQNEMVMVFDHGIHRLMVLRDKVLVLEGEEMSSPSFWGDDEPKSFTGS